MNNYNDGIVNCDDPECQCNLLRAFWVQLDENDNPIDVCWAYYPGDKPIIGKWIKVREEV